MEYVLHVLILMGIYSGLSASLNLIAGCVGLTSLAHAAFFGVGAYVSALLALRLQLPFLVTLFLAVASSGLLALLVGLPSLRFRGDHFVIATFGFQMITFSCLNNFASLTGGPVGLPGIPQPVILGLRIESGVAFLFLVLCFCALTVWLCRRIIRSPLGRVLTAIREDAVIAQVAGKPVDSYKLLVFVIGAGLAAAAGSIYAHYITYIDPSSFTVMESVFIISALIIGGAGSVWGPVAGAALLVAFPELLRFVGLPTATAANIRQVLYGGLLLLFMIWRPQGLLGEYAFTTAIREKEIFKP